MDLQVRNIFLNHTIDPVTLNVTASGFSFELYSEELLEKNWDTIVVYYTIGGKDDQIDIHHVEYYAESVSSFNDSNEEHVPLSELKEELEEDGLSYEDIVWFAKCQVNKLVTKHLGRLF